MRPERFSRRASALSILLILGAVLVVIKGFHQLAITSLSIIGALEGIVLLRTFLRPTVVCSDEMRMIHDAPFGMLFVDKKNVIQLCNDACSLMLGLEKQQILGNTVCDLCSVLKIALDEFEESAEGSIRERVIRNIELEFIHPQTKNAQILLVHLTRVSDHRTDQHLGYNIYFEDVTARTLWERHTLQNEKRLHVAEMAATAAHEIRNPLTTVRGFLQIQQKRHPATNGNRDLYKIMIEELDRVNTLITEYMTYARSPVHSDFVVINMRSLILDALCSSRAESSKPAIDVVCDSLDTSYVQGNPEDLKQVILHLLQNARDASPLGQPIEVRGMQCENVYRVEIIDHGEGISDLSFSHMFDPFFTTKKTGSGLGLSLSKNIVNLHAGTLTACRDENGTHFIMELPLTPCEA
ncbi:two-component system sensor histidine kinase NtrB [Ferroacidibacillus organovorans]|uniref:histidine kinase n=1 Tax=Ferroacidibacillus organovorans TaxID=1765683 RepID=A0A101XS55_9BACL|nr:ATP-binding protein [Ferroacidibacillus organovorans]KUO96549.1 hypothetical protein ATW55_00215 [Ferroacidibacillus organovorans]